MQTCLCIRKLASMKHLLLASARSKTTGRKSGGTATTWTLVHVGIGPSDIATLPRRRRLCVRSVHVERTVHRYCDRYVATCIFVDPVHRHRAYMSTLSERTALHTPSSNDRTVLQVSRLPWTCRIRVDRTGQPSPWAELYQEAYRLCDAEHPQPPQKWRRKLYLRPHAGLRRDTRGVAGHCRRSDTFASQQNA